MTQNITTMLFEGGLDLTTPAVAVRNGSAIGGYNYEAVTGGYRRIGGYERLDGRLRPSRARFWGLGFTNGSADVSPGAVVTGATSGATGIALAGASVTSGSFGGGDAAGVYPIGELSGAFQAGESLTSGGALAVATGPASESFAPTDEETLSWLSAAVERRRALIEAVPGSGPVRGVNVLSGDIYAVRDNAGGTAGVLYKATASGWTAQPLGSTLEFTGASSAFPEGATVTGAVSGATGVVKRAITRGGTYDGSASGVLVLSGVTGTFQSEAISGGGGSANATGAQAATVLPPGGRYRFENHNFYGSVETKRMYGVNGVGRGFAFDGEVFSPIHTGLSDELDKPTHIAEYNEHLFLGFANGSVLFSEIGEPLQYQAIGGAGEIAFGDRITNLIVSNTVLVVSGETQIGYIAGTDSATFRVQEVSFDSGAMEHTAQMVDTPFYFDGGAIRRLTQTEALGGWRMGAAVRRIEPLWENKRKTGAVPTCSYRVRARDHYVMLLSDGTGVTTYLGRREPEAMVIRFPFKSFCAYSGDDSGDERILVGADDGFVYDLDQGRDFDGAEVDYLLPLGFVSIGGVYRNHRWHKARIGVEAKGAVTLAFSSEFSYGDSENPPGAETQFAIFGGGGRWDVANWNEFFWSSPVVGEGVARIDGFGFNIGAALYGEATFEEPHTLNWMSLYSTPRKVNR